MLFSTFIGKAVPAGSEIYGIIFLNINLKITLKLLGLTIDASASARPPPIRKRSIQGILCCTVSQSMRNSTGSSNRINKRRSDHYSAYVEFGINGVYKPD